MYRKRKYRSICKGWMAGRTLLGVLFLIAFGTAYPSIESEIPSPSQEEAVPGPEPARPSPSRVSAVEVVEEDISRVPDASIEDAATCSEGEIQREFTTDGEEKGMKENISDIPEAQLQDDTESDEVNPPQMSIREIAGKDDSLLYRDHRYLVNLPPPSSNNRIPDTPARSEMGNIEVPLIGGPLIHKKVVSMREARFSNMVPQEYDYSCGAASLATLLKYHFGKEISELDAMEGMLKYGNQELIREKGFSLLDMQKFAKHLGYKAEGYRVKVEQLQRIPIPMIVLITSKGQPHFVVLKGAEGEKVFIADPGMGNRTMTIKEFAEVWNDVIFVLQGPTEGKPVGLPLMETLIRGPKGEIVGIREGAGIDIAMDPLRKFYLHLQLPPVGALVPISSH